MKLFVCLIAIFGIQYGYAQNEFLQFHNITNENINGFPSFIQQFLSDRNNSEAFRNIYQDNSEFIKALQNYSPNENLQGSQGSGRNVEQKSFSLLNRFEPNRETVSLAAQNFIDSIIKIVANIDRYGSCIYRNLDATRRLVFVIIQRISICSSSVARIGNHVLTMIRAVQNDIIKIYQGLREVINYCIGINDPTVQCVLSNMSEFTNYIENIVQFSQQLYSMIIKIILDEITNGYFCFFNAVKRTMPIANSYLENIENCASTKV